MKKVLSIVVLGFACTGILAGTGRTGMDANNSRNLKGITREKHPEYATRCIEKDLKSLKKQRKLAEGEKKILRYERNHRIGHLYRLV